MLEPYIHDANINWQEFRENNLTDSDVELVFTMNMPAINALYHQYSKLGSGKNKDEETLTMEDCVKLLSEDSLLKVPQELV